MVAGREGAREGWESRQGKLTILQDYIRIRGGGMLGRFWGGGGAILRVWNRGGRGRGSGRFLGGGGRWGGGGCRGIYWEGVSVCVCVCERGIEDREIGG